MRYIPEYKSVIHQISDLGLSNRARLLGTIDHHSVAERLKAADLFVLPSRSEPFGISILEAMNAGLPIIATRVGGIPEHVKDGEEGYLFPPNDAKELARLIRYLAGRPDRVEKIQPDGNDVSTLFENAEDVEGVYRTLL